MQSVVVKLTEEDIKRFKSRVKASKTEFQVLIDHLLDKQDQLDRRLRAMKELLTDEQLQQYKCKICQDKEIRTCPVG